MPGNTGSGFNGPLRHFGHTGQQFGVNSVGGNTVNKPLSAFLSGCSLEGVDMLQVLPYGTVDDTFRLMGYAWNGVTYPGPYAAGTNFGLTPTLNAGTITQSAALGGGIILTTAAAAQVQIASGTNFQVLTTGRRVFFNIRVTTSVTATEAVLVGLFDALPADVSGALGATNGVFFLKATAGTDYSFNVRKAGTSSTISNVLAASGNTAGLVATTFNDLGFLVDSTVTAGGVTSLGAVSCYVDGRFAGSFASTDANMPTVVLGLAIAAKASAGTPTMTVQQCLCMQEF